jgi:hypothetical protein
LEIEAKVKAYRLTYTVELSHFWIFSLCINQLPSSLNAFHYLGRIQRVKQSNIEQIWGIQIINLNADSGVEFIGKI